MVFRRVKSSGFRYTLSFYGAWQCSIFCCHRVFFPGCGNSRWYQNVPKSSADHLDLYYWPSLSFLPIFLQRQTWDTTIQSCPSPRGKIEYENRYQGTIRKQELDSFNRIFHGVFRFGLLSWYHSERPIQSIWTDTSQLGHVWPYRAVWWFLWSLCNRLHSWQNLGLQETYIISNDCMRHRFGLLVAHAVISWFTITTILRRLYFRIHIILCATCFVGTWHRANVPLVASACKWSHAFDG